METDDKYTHFYVNERLTKKLGKLYDLIELLYGEKKCVILIIETMSQSTLRDCMINVDLK